MNILISKLCLASKCFRSASLCSAILLTILAISGCSAYKRVSSVNPAFLEGADAKSKIENLPFQQAWVREGFDGRNYSKIILKPISTDLLTDWTPSASSFIASKDDYTKEAQEVAKYFYSELLAQLKAYKDNRFTVVDSAGPDVITIEIALTELEFSHPVARAASLASPIPGTGAALSSVSEPHAAFAARISDPSGQLAATVADRKFPPTRILDLNKLTVTSSVREICSLWAKIMAEALNKGRLQKTKGEGSFSIKPW